METRLNFLKPRLTGERFDSHTLPVNILEDFSALEELIFDVAKQIYLEENPDKKRVPNRFTEDVRLSIASIEEGSAMPNLVLIYTTVATLLIPNIDPGSFKYFEKAKDRVIETIINANNNAGISLDDKYINYFNRLGRNLQEDESIDFLPNTDRKAILSPKIRSRILRSKGAKSEYYEPYSFYASIPSVDKKDGIFKLDIEGITIECNLNDCVQFYDTILSVFNDYEKNTLVSIKAIGVYNELKKLVAVRGMESMEILDPFDVNVRIDYLLKLEDNWYNDYSKAPTSSFLEFFRKHFMLSFDKTLKLPSIFPTFEGNLQLEWSFNVASVILELDDTFSADLLIAYNDGRIDNMKLNLNVKEDWELLNINIKSLS